jgi:nucleotide-binding universal stress UspA family protein
MTIIAAVDLSPASVNAARSAALLARHLRARLILVRAIEPMSAVYPELMLAGAIDVEAAVRAGTTEALANIALALSDAAPGIEIESRVLAGVPHEVLIGCAREEKARLIVMGTRGRGAIGRLLVGSVAQRTLRASTCPVLILREGAAPFATWGAGKPALKVVVGVDRSAASEAALALVTALRAAGPCDVTLVHEYWPPGEYARLGLRGPRDLIHDDQEIVAVLNRELRAVWAELPPGSGAGQITTRVTAGWGAPGLELAMAAEAGNADLLIMGTMQPHGLARVRHGSDAITALQNCHVPLLVVPAEVHGVAAAARPIPLIRSVLVATDGSDLGNAAIPHACALARRSGARIEICHVHERTLPGPSSHGLTDPPSDLSAAQRQQLERDLTAAVPHEAQQLGITSHVTIVDGGSAAEQIVQAASRLGVDAIVLSSHGRGGLGRALFGSVAHAVLHKSPVPVTIVPPARGV